MKSITLYTAFFFAYFLLSSASSLLIKLEPSEQQLVSIQAAPTQSSLAIRA